MGCLRVRSARPAHVPHVRRDTSCGKYHDPMIATPIMALTNRYLTLVADGPSILTSHQIKPYPTKTASFQCR
jgi:hypothetical protein